MGLLVRNQLWGSLGWWHQQWAVGGLHADWVRSGKCFLLSELPPAKVPLLTKLVKVPSSATHQEHIALCQQLREEFCTARVGPALHTSYLLSISCQVRLNYARLEPASGGRGTV